MCATCLRNGEEADVAGGTGGRVGELRVGGGGGLGAFHRAS